MTDVRLLCRASDDVPMPTGDGAPRGNSKESLQARNALGEFLDVVLLRPLYFSEGQQMERVEQSLNTMTRSERVLLEIEMTERRAVMHSFDYDALR